MFARRESTVAEGNVLELGVAVRRLMRDVGEDGR